MGKIDIKKLFENMDSEWIKVFTSPELKHIVCDIIKILSDNKENDHNPYNIFNFAKHVKYTDLKAIIIYEDIKSSLNMVKHSFGCPKTMESVYSCLKAQNLINNIPTTDDISFWSHQGILLLNTTLYSEGEGMKILWGQFIDTLIKCMSYKTIYDTIPSLSFFLWGSTIEKKHLMNEDCLIYEWCHPNPLCRTSSKPINEFDKCTNFIEFNEFLISENIDPIDWNPISSSVIYTDGACSNNGKGISAYAGYSVYFNSGLKKNTIKYGRIPPSIIGGKTIHPSNQRAEGLAICIALENSKEEHITIITDSQFWINMIEDWMPKWERK
jgi:uracil DNA glycosylase